MSLISIWAVGLFVLAQVISTPLATIFVGYDHDLFLLTRHGFRIYCVTFLINGFNIYGSAFFTALSNGLISATISFLRTLIFQIAAILILPAIFGINGIWIAVAMAELLTLCFTATFFIKQKKSISLLKRLILAPWMIVYIIWGFFIFGISDVFS